MDYAFKQTEGIGIYSFNGELTKKNKETLQLLLLRAIHSIDRVVFNFKNVGKIDAQCLELLRRAYCTSVRLNNPVIMTYIPTFYMSEILRCGADKAINH